MKKVRGLALYLAHDLEKRWIRKLVAAEQLFLKKFITYSVFIGFT